MKVVTFGGGGGQNRVLTTLCFLKKQWGDLSITAIPTTADSGGSSGILRLEHGIIAVGDIGQCVAGLHPEPESIAWLLESRIENGTLRGHTPRNVMVLSAIQHFGPVQEAMDAIAYSFKLMGSITPVTFDQADLCARLGDGTVLRTEDTINQCDLVAHGGVEHLWLEGDPKANPAALEAIAEADVIITCPGTLTCSIVPPFLVGGVREAVANSSAQRLCITNLINAYRHVSPEWGVVDHVRCLEHYMRSPFDTVICNTQQPTVEQTIFYAREGNMMPPPTRGLHLEGKRIIARPLLADVAPVYTATDSIGHLRASVRHDPLKLAHALEEALNLSEQRLAAAD